MIPDVRGRGQKNESYLVVDEQPEAGGLASTDVTAEGFLFDVGGSAQPPLDPMKKKKHGVRLP